ELAEDIGCAVPFVRRRRTGGVGGFDADSFRVTCC
ncbi:unnamed protein product, partial [Rotaria socialis]